MIPESLFEGLPFGVCPFSLVENRLLPCRAAARLPGRAKSVISVLFPYYLGEEYYTDSNISMYAVPADYHMIAGDMLAEIARRLSALYPAYRFEAFCDNSPIPEVFAASCAGLGAVGRNGLLIHPAYGSFCFIGEIVTDMPIDAAADGPTACANCGQCVRACPSRALYDARLEKDKCLSHISQKKKEPDEKERDMISESGCAWGCDVCQKVCPMNRAVKKTPIRAFYETAKPVFTTGDPVEGRAFAWRGERVINRNIEIIGASKGNTE